MEIQLIKELKNFEFKTCYKHYKVNNTYDVFILDGEYTCTCSLKYNRIFGSVCKHIQEVKKNG